MSNEQIGWHEELVADLKLLTALVEAHYPAVVVVETKPS